MMIRLRRYQSCDKQALTSLWQDIFAASVAYNEHNLILEQRLKENEFIFIAEKSGNIVGYCIAGYDDHKGWLHSTYIHPQSRRIGLGSKLVKHAISSLKNCGCKKIDLPISKGDQQVNAFYHSLHFK